MVPGMAAGRSAASTVAVLVLAACLAPGARAARGAGALAPYRDLARGPAAARVLALARSAMEGHWSGAAPDTAGVPDWPGEPAALYVSLVRGHVTRACVGSPAPPRGTLAESVRELALAVLASDTRRPPVRRDELAGLRIVVAFAGPGEPVADPARVDVAREGLLVGGPDRHVAFLPGEARTAAWAVREARRVGALEPGTPPEYQRFDVVTVIEPEKKPPGGGSPDEED